MLQFARIAWMASLFSVLMVWNVVLSPFIEGPHRFFCTCIELSLAGVVLAWGFTGQDVAITKRLWAFMKHPVSIAVAIFIAVCSLSTAFALYPQLAFWSNLTRGDGLYTLLHLYGFFILAGILLDKPVHWKWALGCFCAAAIGVILVGIWFAADSTAPFGGYFSTDPEVIRAPTTFGRLLESRFYGAIGNADFAPMYLLFTLFFAVYAPTFFKIKTQWVKKGCYLLAAVYGVFIILSQTRGIFMGLLAGLMVGCVYLAFFHPIYRRRVTIFFTWLASLGALALLLRSSPILRKLPGGRLLTILDLDSSSTERLTTWKTASKIFLERPFLGFGFDNFLFPWQAHYDPSTLNWIDPTTRGSLFDRSHNLVLDYLTQIGTLGFLAYLGIFIVIAVLLYRASIRKKVLPLESFLFPFFLSTYWVQGIFIFDTFSVYLGLFVFFALFIEWHKGLQWRIG